MQFFSALGRCKPNASLWQVMCGSWCCLDTIWLVNIGRYRLQMMWCFCRTFSLKGYSKFVLVLWSTLEMEWSTEVSVCISIKRSLNQEAIKRDDWWRWQGFNNFFFCCTETLWLRLNKRITNTSLGYCVAFVSEGGWLCVGGISLLYPPSVFISAWWTLWFFSEHSTRREGTIVLWQKICH